MQGIRVVDLTAHLSGPYCTWQLAALGADVIKIEPPGTGEPARETPPFRDGHSLYFDSLNRGKRSLALDLRTPDGKAILHKLLATADLLIENFRTGVRDRLGCSDAELDAVNPKLIRVSISGFGQEGSLAKRSAFDIIVQAMSGMMSINGPEGGPLCRVGFSIGDIAAGLFATVAILDRLYERDCRGVERPAPIDISMLACQVALLENAYARYLNTGKVPQPLGTRHPSATPFESFPTADEPIVIANSGRKGWPVFCEAVGLGEVALDAAAGALGDLVLGQRGEEAGGGPALLVGAFGEARPDVGDRGQPQITEQNAEPGGVDRIGRGHAGAPSEEAAPVVSTS